VGGGRRGAWPAEFVLTSTLASSSATHPRSSKASSPASSPSCVPTRSQLARPSRSSVGEDYRTITFASGRGFLDYEVFEDRQLVVIDELTWLGD
jgi:hypothetical protein